jgi:hypothetical protein
LKLEDALSPLLFNFTLDYAIRGFQVNLDGLKLNGTHQLPVYAYDVNILGGSVYIIKKNAEAIVVARMETGIEVNADKTNNMVMSRNQNAGRCHSIKTDYVSFERVEEFTYWGTTLTIQYFIQKEIKSRLKSGNAC